MDTAKELLIRAVVYLVAGFGMETAFTATGNARANWRRGDKSLHGYSSLWYGPLYALASPIFYYGGSWLFAQPWYVRGLIYTGIFYILEYSWMWTIRHYWGKSPSEKSYQASPLGIHGLIRLDFAPAWFAAGFLLEWLYRHLQV